MVDLVDSHGRPRVVVTGMGVKTPAGVDRRHVLGRGPRRPSAPPRPSSASTRPSSRCGSRARSSSTTRRSTSTRRRRAGSTASRSSGSARPPTRSTTPASSAPTPAGARSSPRTGVGGLETMEENESTFLTRGASRVSPFFVPDDDAERGGGDDLDPLRVHRARRCASPPRARPGANAIGEGVRMVRDGSAEVVVAGAHRGPGHAADGFGVRPHGRDEHPQRRPVAARRVRSTPPATGS